MRLVYPEEMWLLKAPGRKLAPSQQPSRRIAPHYLSRWNPGDRNSRILNAPREVDITRPLKGRIEAVNGVEIGAPHGHIA